GFRLPKHIWAMRELMKAFPDLKTDQQLLEAGTQERMRLDHLLDIRKNPMRCAGSPLRPYQEDDVSYLKCLPAAGIFNEPRTGKTPTTITLLKETGKQQNLVICPASLIWNWAKEFEKWWPEIG